MNCKYKQGEEYGADPEEYSRIDGVTKSERRGIDLAKRIIKKESSVVSKYKTDDS
jgi:hypothetical protein